MLILGGGWYGCHLASTLLRAGVDVRLKELKSRLFAGASGNNPARLHQGVHYPRSGLTINDCIEQEPLFLNTYGKFTSKVSQNIYAVADEGSFVDFRAYTRMIEGSVPFIILVDPKRLGLQHVEGAIQVHEQHIVIDEVREHFEVLLKDVVEYGSNTYNSDDYDWVIDCTFNALSGEDLAVDRYEPCLVVLLKGPVETAVTIMDGPFPSLYPWNENAGLCSLSSALLTPLSKSLRTYGAAKLVMEQTDQAFLVDRSKRMIAQMAHYYPAVMRNYQLAETRLSIRAMPSSAADARLCNVFRAGERLLRVYAGKISAIFKAEQEVMRMLAI